jgi:hypothetical protein
MKNWIDIGSNVNWQDHGGNWAKKAKDGSYFVITFVDFHYATGATEGAKYYAILQRVDLSDLPADTIKSAMKYCGFDDLDAGEINEIMIVEACAGYGAAQPLQEFLGNRAASVRAAASRAAESYMRDAYALDERLERQVNAIGNNAKEYARGEFWSKRM